jgi:hypothetical protein
LSNYFQGELFIEVCSWPMADVCPLEHDFFLMKTCTDFRFLHIPGGWILHRILSHLVGSDHPTESDGIPGNGSTVGSDGKKHFLIYEWISIFCQQSTRVIQGCWIPMNSDIRSDRIPTIGYDSRSVTRNPIGFHRFIEFMMKSDEISVGIR